MKKFLHLESEFDTGIIAEKDGIYELQLKFNGQIFSLQQTFSIGETLIFDITVLNEDYIYTCIRLLDPDNIGLEIEPIQIRIAL